MWRLIHQVLLSCTTCNGLRRFETREPLQCHADSQLEENLSVQCSARTVRTHIKVFWKDTGADALRHQECLPCNCEQGLRESWEAGLSYCTDIVSFLSWASSCLTPSSCNMQSYACSVVWELYRTWSCATAKQISIWNTITQCVTPRQHILLFASLR